MCSLVMASGPVFDSSQRHDDGLRILQVWGLLEVFAVDVQEEMVG